MISNDILFGLLALQNGYVDRSQLVRAFSDWVVDQSRSIAERLIEQKSISLEDGRLVQQLVQKYQSLEPAQQSQSLFSSASSLHDELTRLANHGNLGLDQRELFSQTMDFFKTKSQDSFDTINSLQGSSSLPMGMDRFRIVKEHARGGLGVVFLAEDQQLRREVAVKRIRDDRADFESVRAKFRKEAEVTGQLEHPGIVPIYSLGTDENGRPFYAMRFIRGESLQDRIEAFHDQLKNQATKMDSPQLRQLLRRFIDICNAMDYAHEQGILHRDLKPGNIMLGKYGETLVVDWGLAKSVATTESLSHSEKEAQLASELFSDDEAPELRTREGSFLGTAAYAPPEQLRGEIDRLSRGSDVYSLGAILFQILFGRPPVIKAESIANAIEQIDALQHRDLRELRSDIPESLAYVCSKAIRMDIIERFESVSQLRDGVQAWLDDQAVPGMRESLRAKTGRWIRNHQTIVAASLVGLVAVIGLLGISVLSAGTFYWQEKKHAAREDAFKIIADAKREADTEREQAKFERMLSDAQLARNRGQFLVAYELMQDVSEQLSLSEDQLLSMARDLYFAQKIDPAWNALQKINRDSLTLNKQPELDLLRGDMQLMTSSEKEGFALIRQAIASELLSPADLSYAKALVADSSEECLSEFQNCIRLDPLNLNAISKYAVTCVLVGAFEEAQKNTDFGQSIAPDDVRFQFLAALIPAVKIEEAKARAAIDRLKETKSLAAEVQAIEIVLSLSKAFENYALSMHSVKNPNPASMTIVELTMKCGSILSFAKKKNASPSFTAFPTMAWMGKINAASIVAGMIRGDVSSQLSQVSEVLPRNQYLHYVIGLSRFGSKDPNQRGAYESFRDAIRCDPISAKIQTKLTWFALGCLASDSIISKSTMNDSEVVELVRWIQAGKAKDGRYEFSPWQADTAFKILVHVKMLGIAIELAQQELQTAPDSEKANWQKRIDDVRKLDSRFTTEVREIANPQK